MDPDRRPNVTVMAEYRAGRSVWERPGGSGDLLDVSELLGLGVSVGLAERLRAWNDRYEDLASTGYEWPRPE